MSPSEISEIAGLVSQRQPFSSIAAMRGGDLVRALGRRLVCADLMSHPGSRYRRCSPAAKSRARMSAWDTLLSRASLAAVATLASGTFPRRYPAIRRRGTAPSAHFGLGMAPDPISRREDIYERLVEVYSASPSPATRPSTLSTMTRISAADRTTVVVGRLVPSMLNLSSQPDRCVQASQTATRS